MQIKVELLNNFHRNNVKVMNSKTTRDLTIDEATAMYNFFEKLLDKLQEKNIEYWKEKREPPQELYNLVLNEVIEESNSGLAEDDWEDIIL